MHDVTRELCLREAQNVNFVNFLGGTIDENPFTQSLQCSSTNRGRIGIHNKEELVRYRNSEPHSIIMICEYQSFEPELPFKLVRVLDLASVGCPTFSSGILSLIHLRYLSLSFDPPIKPYLESKRIVIPPSISSLCYMETFILDLHCVDPLILPSEILMMLQLRHLRLTWNYLDYYELTRYFVLKNLRCLSGLNPVYCTRFFFRLFPNLKELQVRGISEDFYSCKDLHDFRYLDQLQQLEFYLENSTRTRTYSPLLLPPPCAFPKSLKELAFTGAFLLPLKDLTIVGKLPKLESLKLLDGAFVGKDWEVAEEGFPHLKFLLMRDLDIQHWRASSDHFPCLERLILDCCLYLDSVPQDFADITTLALIDINLCAASVVKSAIQIQQDIQDNYGGSIEVYFRDTINDDDDFVDDFDEDDDLDDDDVEGSAPDFLTL